MTRARLLGYAVIPAALTLAACWCAILAMSSAWVAAYDTASTPEAL